MAESPAREVGGEFRVGVLTQGLWGGRIADNLDAHRPADWSVWRWQAPPVLPLVVDDGRDFLPYELPPADLLLALGETPGAAQLVPDMARLSGARSVIAPIDRNESLPPGLARQLRGWLADLGVGVVFPKPFCSLTESTYNLPPILEHHDDPLVARFAGHFGRPELNLPVAGQCVGLGTVGRDSACGCARHVLSGLAGCAVEEAIHTAGMLHHHYPCLASMNIDPDYHDTLMHVSGHLLRRAVQSQVGNHLEPVTYLRPDGRSEPGPIAGPTP